MSRLSGPTAHGFGSRLLLVLLAVVVPVLIIAGAGIALFVESYRTEFRTSREATARALATAVDAEIERLKPMLRGLAGIRAIAPQPDAADLADLHERASRHAAAFGTVVWAEAATGAWLMSTARSVETGKPRGRPPPAPMAEARARAATTMRPAVADLGIGVLPDDRPAAAVEVPVVREGQLVAWMGASLSPDALSRLLAAQRPAEGEFMTLLDGAGHVVARAPADPRLVGMKVPAWFAPAIDGAVSGTRIGTATDGRRMVISFARLPATPRWVITYGTPESAYRESWQRPLLFFGGGAIGTLALAWLGAGVAARRLLRPLQEVTARAEALAAGAEPPPARPGTGPRVAEFERLDQAVRRSEDLLRAQAVAARREEALLRSVLGSASEAISVKDRDGRYRLANPVAAALHGLPAEAMIGRTDGELGLAPAPARQAAERAALASGGVEFFEEHLPGPAGERVLRTAVAPWRDPEGDALLGAVSISRDITAPLEAERRRRVAERDMQALMRRSTVGALAAGIAHEVGQPLSAALNLLHVARREAEGAPAGAPPALAAAEEQVLRAGAILRQIRRFLSQRDVERVPAAVPPLVENGLRLALGGQPQERLAALSVAPGLPEVIVSPVQVEQVVVNLIRNAAEALEEVPPGQPRRIDIAVRPAQHGGVRVTIADTGPGLPPARAARPFEEFTSTRAEGSGLGLAICRTIIEENGGEIVLRPRPGGGTVAEFTLPAAPRPSPGGSAA
jgi:PAS domain S-box-containing protein